MVSISNEHIEAVKNNDQIRDLLISIQKDRKQRNFFERTCLDYLNFDFFINFILILFIKYGDRGQDWLKSIHDLTDNFDYGMLSEDISIERKNVERIIKIINNCIQHVIEHGKEELTGVSSLEINELFCYMYDVYNSIFEIV